MYNSSLDKEYSDETRFAKKSLIWVVGFFFVVGVFAWFLTRSSQVVDTAFVNYEQFQEIYNTCQKINTDLATIRAVADNDKMFDSFSKQAKIANKRQQMARWVEEYNAKSKMWNRAMWKSSTLPYQMDVNQFSHYDERVSQ
jgi:hypothetical protein